MINIVYKCCIYCTHCIYWDIVPIDAIYCTILYTILERLGLQMPVIPSETVGGTIHWLVVYGHEFPSQCHWQCPLPGACLWHDDPTVDKAATRIRLPMAFNLKFQ